MKQNNLKKWVVGGAAALMLTAGVAWTADSTYASSLVQEVTQETPGSIASTLRFVHHGAGSSSRLGGVNSDELLAAALNVSVEELEAAKTAAHSAAIDQAVAEGLITQERADALRARSEESGRIGRFRSDTIDYDTLLADALGIGVEQLEAAEETAFVNGLEQAVAEGTITQEQADLKLAQRALKAYLSDSTASTREEAVQQAVQDGVVTQEQADQLLSSGRGFGGRGSRGRGFDGPNGNGTDGNGTDGNGTDSNGTDGNETNGARFQAPANTVDAASNL